MNKRGKKSSSQNDGDAQDRIVERGIVQFRADKELMQKLLQISAYKRLPLGPMVRSWVVDRLRLEFRGLVDNPPVDLLLERRQFDYLADWLRQSGSMLHFYDRMLADMTVGMESVDRAKFTKELQPLVKAARDCLVHSQELTVHLEEKVNNKSERRECIQLALQDVSDKRKALLKTLTTLTHPHIE